MSRHYNEFMGIVTGRRNLGGVFFLNVSSGEDQVKVIMRKSDSSPDLREKVGAIRRGDLVHIRCMIQHDDNVLVDVMSVYKSSLKHEDSAVRKRALLLAMSQLFEHVRHYLSENSFAEIRLPSIHFGVGRGHVFYIDYFGHQGRLSSSNALFLTVAAGHLGHCYSLERVFRAEPSSTSKHLTEFDMLEVALLGSGIDESMDQLERLIASLLNVEWPSSVMERILRLRKDVCIPFRKVPYLDIEKEYGLNGRGLGAHERSIASRGPVFVVNFPQGISSWASRKYNGRLTHSFNLLLPDIGEVAEGSERDTDVYALEERFKEWHMKRQLGWYGKGIRYPNARISIYGLGIERLAMWLFGVSNIRETVLFVRDGTFREIE